MNWSIVKILLSLATCITVTGGDRYHPVDVSLRNTPHVAEKYPNYWWKQAETSILASWQAHAPASRARNVVLFMGDGMSIPTLTAARIRLGQLKGSTGEEAELFFDSFPTTGLVKVVMYQLYSSQLDITIYVWPSNSMVILNLNCTMLNKGCKGSLGLLIIR